MANATYVQGTVSVGTTATKIASPADGTGGIYLTNGGSAVLILGGSTVTATGLTEGPSLASGASIILPTAGGAHDLYGITASGTAAVSFIYPA